MGDVDILNCPICNTAPDITPDIVEGQYTAYCLNNHRYVIGSSRMDAINKWNEMCVESVVTEPRILDSGNRTEFATGAVRDMREGKGRMDLMPLGVVAKLLDDGIIECIKDFQITNDSIHLYDALIDFVHEAYDDHVVTMLLEVGKHFEEGAKKYGENNWQKGIEPKYYIDSAIRHYLKWRRGDKDEPHDRAFVWNIMCCIWEVDWHVKGDVHNE